MIGRDLTQGNVTKTLLRFTVPFLVANILHTLYGIVDMYIVGQYADATQLSAVSVGTGIIYLANGLMMGLGAGGTVLAGQMVGARKDKDLDETVSTIFSVFPLFAIVLMILGFIFRDGLLHLVNAPEQSYAGARAYFSICLIGLIFTGLFNAISAVLRGMGDSKGPTIFISIATVCNIFGDIFCVGILKMGAAGAALATTVSQGLSVVLGYFYLKKHHFPFDFKPSSFKIFGSKFRMLLRIGIPTALQEVLTSISFVVLEAIINSMGYVASASVGVADRVFNVSIVPGIAFSSAIAAMVAQNTGAAEYGRSRKSLRVGLVICFVVAAVIFCTLAIFPQQIIGAFTKETEVIVSGADYMTFYKYDCLLCTLAFCINGYINGTGHTRYTMIVNLVASFAVRLPLVWLLSRLPNTSLRLISLGIPSASLVQLIIGIAFLLFARSEKESRQRELRA